MLNHHNSNENSKNIQSKHNSMVFGYIWSAIFVFFAIKFHYFFWFVSFFFFAISCFFPAFFVKTKIIDYWSIFGNFIGKINSTIIMFLLFFVLFMPIGFVLKLFGKDLLQKKLQPNSNSYFTARKTQPGSMINQF
jgi:hypothetical protein